MLLNLIRIWLGPLPKEEIFPSPKPNPLNHWFFHPIKRRLAKYYLWLLQNLFGLQVIAITGSVGKTTTKDMLASILASQGPTVATTANITPTYNIPTTILRCTPATRYLILEMGVEYIGDMTFYTWLARPDIAIITAVNLTHTLHFGDLKTVAHEKGLIGKNAKYLIIPDSDPNIEINTTGQVIKLKTKDYQLPATLIGNHFKLNASLAAKTAELLGVSPTTYNQQLTTFTPPPHRMNLIKLQNGGYIIDDTYNANPLATREALTALIETAKKLKKTPVFVFGQMNELGQYEKSAHEEIGLKIKSLNIKHLYCLGPATKHTIKYAGLGHYFDNPSDLYNAIYKILDTKYLILIKSSRGWHLEDLVKKLVEAS